LRDGGGADPVILSRRRRWSAKRGTPQDGEGSQDAQPWLKPTGIQRRLGSLRSFGVLRRSLCSRPRSPPSSEGKSARARRPWPSYESTTRCYATSMDLFNRPRMPLWRSETRFRRAFLLNVRVGVLFGRRKMLLHRSLALSIKQKLLLTTSMDLLNRLRMLVWKTVFAHEEDEAPSKEGKFLAEKVKILTR